MYIKRFESVLIDDDLESCKDIIETLDEFEENLEINHYNIGYKNNNSDVTSRPENEKAKKSIRFALSIKGMKNRIKEKSDFDNIILLSQRAKYLYSKFEKYCNDIEISINNNGIFFLLLFENTDEEGKNQAKKRRILKEIVSYFKDYENVKTITLNRNPPNILFNEIAKDDESYSKTNKYRPEEYAINEVKLRFAVDINYNPLDSGAWETIEIRPKTFRYESYYHIWKKLRSNKTIIDIVSKSILDNMKMGGYHMKEVLSLIDIKLDKGTIYIKCI